MSQEDNFFTDIDEFNTFTIADPVAEYLDSSTLAHVSDPIKYWQSQLTGGHPLAYMGLDFLSAPAALTNVEHAFSRKGLTVSKHHHALLNKSFWAVTVLGS